MSNANFAMRRYLALWFPFLSADRLRMEQPDARPQSAATLPKPGAGQPAAPSPLVLVAMRKGALRLQAVDAQAQQQGLVPGLTLADARALQPDLRVAESDAAADHRWLERLARRCMHWSPLVAMVPPDGITLDIAGTDHLFGGEAGLAAQVEDDLAASGMTVRLATAPTAAAAQALARHAVLPVSDEPAAIRALPVAALGLSADAALALRRAGLSTIGAVAARPMASIAARFGGEAVTALRQLIGEESAPIMPLVQPPRLHFERRFAEPVALQATIASCLQDLLHTAAQALEARDLGARRFVLTLLRSDGARYRLAIATSQPTRDPALVLRLFDERIDSLADPLDPGFGYDQISLSLPVVEPLAAAQTALAPESGAGQNKAGENRAGQAPQALVELIDRLSTRLGEGSLRRLVPQDRHLPELAQLSVPASHQRASAGWPVSRPVSRPVPGFPPSAGEPPLRPLFLLDPPQPVEVVAAVPDGPPHRFRWRQALHEVRLYEGPERIAAEWWRLSPGHAAGGAGPGRAGLTRDYYRIEDLQGRRYWLFRHGLYDEHPDPRWYLHGLFA